MKLADNVAIVTGGGGSIGRSVALGLAAEGATVVVADLDAERARAVAGEVEAGGGAAMAIPLDICDRSAVQAMADAVMERYGRIDILVNNAGGSARRQSRLFHESDFETLDRVLGVNLMGVLYGIRAVLNPMLARRRGRIVNIASIVALQGKPRHVDYAAAKGAVIALTRSLALEVGPHGVTVNCVSPGLVPRKPERPEFADRTNVLGRVCTPDDVAHLVVFLTTEDASFITGQNYVVDGGRSLGLRGDA